MKNLIFIGALLFSNLTFSFDIRFSHGEQIVTDEIEGHLSVRCRDGNNTNYNRYNCYSIDLLGGNYGQITISNGTIDADWVKLQREGSKYIKGAKFYSKKGETKKSFNLWITTLLQRPLLKRGENKINFTFTKNENVVETGFFIVNVVEGESRICRSGSLSYSGSCPSAISACNEFFYRRNYCQ